LCTSQADLQELKVNTDNYPDIFWAASWFFTSSWWNRTIDFVE